MPTDSCATRGRPRPRRRLSLGGASSRVGKTNCVWGARGAQEDHLGQVERHRAVLDCQVVPALTAVEGATEAPEGLLGDADTHHLAALESDLDSLHLLGHRHPPRQSSSPAGSTSSVSTPSPALGCRNATRLPLIPTRASPSIRSTPASFRRERTASMSSTR